MNVVPQIKISDVELPEFFEPFLRRVRFKGLHGGRASGKSHSFASLAVIRGIEHPIRVLCCREFQKSLEESVKELIEIKIKEYGFEHMLRSTRTSTSLSNGTEYIYEGLRANPTAIKSMEALDVAYVEQAEMISKASLEILIPTLRKNGSELWFAWNPHSPKDPVDQMFRGHERPPLDPELSRFYDEWMVHAEVNHFDNPWFPATSRYQMELDREREPDKYAHIWCGQYQTKSESRVFRNWRIAKREEVEKLRQKSERFYFGGDFGFGPDPSVLLRCFMVGRMLVIDAEAWAKHCSDDFLPFLWGGCEDQELRRMNAQAWEELPFEFKRAWRGIEGARKWPITADSADPNRIDYLRRHGFPRIQRATKGPNSVEQGIEYLNTFEILISEDCPHTFDEFASYSFKMDLRTEEILPVLEDKDNHTIDSLRYAVEGVRRGRLIVGAAKGAY